MAEHTAQASRSEPSLQETRELLQDAERLIRQLSARPHTVGRVVAIGDDHVTLLARSELLVADKPNTVALHVGDTVALNDASAIVNTVPDLRWKCEPASVSRVLSSGEVLVEVHGSVRTMVSRHDVQEGDEVLVDSAASVIVARITGQTKAQDSVIERVQLPWESIGGQERAVAAMREAVETPILHRDLMRAYKRRPSKGILLYGPPGNGKTMLGKAAATALAKAHGHADAGFLYVKGPELLSMWVGQTEKAIRTIFAKGREYAAIHGAPMTIFFDECESMMGRRGGQISSDVSSTIVPQFLSEMDGLDDHDAPFLILATNRPDRLDSAVVREGRIDARVMVPMPTRSGAEQILMLHMRDVPGVCDAAATAKSVADDVFASWRKLADVKFRRAGVVPFTFGDAASGAVLAAIVNNAISVAMRRDVLAARRQPSGVVRADFTRAINDMMESYRDVSHADAIDAMADKLNDQVVTTHKEAFAHA